jgi:hypothetical protein
MNTRIEKLANIWANRRSLDPKLGGVYTFNERALEVFAQKVVEETLDEVQNRAYYTGDRDWSDKIDRQWIQLEFGYGPLSDAQQRAEYK